MNRDTARIALVTGASRGIGHATAKRLLALGHRVVALDQREIDPSSLLDGRDADALWTQRTDVTDTAGIHALRDDIKAKWGDVSVLVNNAAVSPKNKATWQSSGILDISPEEWELVIGVNLTAVLRVSQAFLPGMKAQGWGRIVNVASLAGRTKSMVAGGSYMASKAGVLGLTRAIAAEMGRHGITANAVAPGRILTEMTAPAGPEENQRQAETIPVRRLGTVDEVAASIVFLASEDSGFINGGVIDVNGGIFMP